LGCHSFLFQLVQAVQCEVFKRFLHGSRLGGGGHLHGCLPKVTESSTRLQTEQVEVFACDLLPLSQRFVFGLHLLQIAEKVVAKDGEVGETQRLQSLRRDQTY